MAEYDFSTLSSSDFEDLACDLMNLQQTNDSSIRYKTFKDGKDKGIDFLYSTEENQFEHVGQAKHFYRSGISNLLSTLKNKEFKKVVKLAPNKYIIFTSVDLGVSDTESIKNIFEPYIKSLTDIYAKKDINQLIEQYPIILDTHFKLWFSDISILQKILNSGLEFRSSNFIKHEIERRISLYVKTQNFDLIRDALKEHKSVIITGEPGVGKTMLAEMLCYEFIKNDYKLHYLSKISEFEVLLQADDSNQIFYFDDFLGSNKVEISKAKESETELTRILKRISNLENKYFIFTTRNFLFNTAIGESENLKRLNIKSKEKIFNLKEYSSELKKQMLSNHIDFSELDDDYKKVLIDNDIFSFLTEHQNFSPRSIEFITNKEVILEIPVVDFKQFILHNFNNPSQIWEHAYKFQIYEDDRLLLNTLFSFGDFASLAHLEKAFSTRLEFESKTNNKTNDSDAFNSSIKRLLGGFIKEKNGGLEFINPSIIDFLEYYLISNITEVKHIAEAVCFTQQLTERLFVLSHKIRSHQDWVPENLINKLLNNYSSFVTREQRDLDLLRLALVLFKYVKRDDFIEVITEIIYEIEDWSDLYNNYEINVYFIEFIQLTNSVSTINDALKERSTEFAIDLIRGEKDIIKAIEMVDKLAFEFDIDFTKINKQELESYLNDLLNEYIYYEIETLEEFITDEIEAIEKISEIKNYIDILEERGFQIYSMLTDYSKYDWCKIAWDNEFRRLMEKND